MNGATALVLGVVILMIIGAAYGTYRMVKDHTYCSECPNKGECCGNPINCTIRNE